MENKVPTDASLVRLPEISRAALVLGVVFLFSIGFLFFIEQILRPQCCDADFYLRLAEFYNKVGILTVPEETRTFAYPWILSFVIKLSQLINLPVRLLVFLVQIFIYYLALVVVSNVANEYSKKLSAAIYIALSINIFVIPYAGITLTDSIYTSLSIILFGGIMKIEYLQKTEQSISSKWVFLVVFLLSLAITTRPASIWLSAPALYCLARLVWKRNVDIVDVILAVIAGAAPLYVQIVINVINFKIISFLPVSDLGGAQIKWGIENVKYGTWLGGGAPGNYYLSKHLINITVGELNLMWYFNNPVDAVKLLTFKLIGAFDFDYIMPYPYRQPASKWLISGFSFTIFWVGMFGVFVHLFTEKLVVLGSRFMPLIIFTAWCSVSLISALELRFTLPLISYFIIVSCAVINYIILDRNKKLILILIVGWIIIMPFFYQAAKIVRLQSVVQG